MISRKIKTHQRSGMYLKNLEVKIFDISFSRYIMCKIIKFFGVFLHLKSLRAERFLMAFFLLVPRILQKQ